MSDGETPLKEGFLWFPPQGVLGQLKKSWQKKYCQLFKSSKHGIDRLEVFDSGEEVGKTSSNVIITLENCVKITQDAQKHQSFVFAVITKSSSYYFSANSEDEMNKWIFAFQSVAFKDNISRQTIEEDNDLYCSSENAGLFQAKLIISEASTRCGLAAGSYTLLVTPNVLQLLNSEDQRTLFTWPYRYIRRYGYRCGKFWFEAGRNCETGPGTFYFEHSKEIFKCISTKMKNMKTMLSSETRPFFCGDNQFQAVSYMPARSRSPFPPSLINASPLLDPEICGFPQMKPLIPFHSSSNSNSVFVVNSHDVLSSLLEPKMNQTDLLSLKWSEKPSRKVTPVSEIENDVRAEASDSHEHQLPYDDVEVRNEAWRTMGIDLDNHVDLFKATPVQTVPHRTISPKLEKSDAQKIFHVNSGSGNYDKLQHIGPATKPNPASGYKQIPIITNSMSNLRLEEPIFACRRADDFKGYGMIRKKSTVDTSNEDVSKQFLSEDIKYTIVYKPERV